ncbi:MAG: O-antigen ligase family protein [Actinomycetota bacterium]
MVVGIMADRRRLLLDGVGLVLLSMTVLWVFVSSLVTKSDPMQILALLSALAVGVVAGRLLPGVVPMVVVAITMLLFVINPLEFISRDPGGFPFGYANAKGAFLVQAAAAALIVARTIPAGGLATAAITGAVIFGVVPLLFESLAAGTLGLVVVAIGLAGALLTKAYARSLGILLGMVFVVVFSTTLLIAATETSTPAVVGDVIGDTLSERRKALWTDALSAMRDNPLVGVGPGNFENVSDIARVEDDVRWVPSAFLEQGAEGGILGLVLMFAIFLWGFVRLMASDGPGPVIAIGIAALFGIAVHVCMDYVLHYPAVPMVAGALLGSATSSAWERAR